MRTSSRLEVKVDGRWLRSLGHVSKIDYSTVFGEGPCGPQSATVEVTLPRRDDAGFLLIGRTVEIYESGTIRFGGKLSGASRGSMRTLEVKGWARVAWDAISSPTPGQRVGRTSLNTTSITTDPTTPRWLLDAKDLDISVADDRLFTQIVTTYVSAAGANGNPDTTQTFTTNDTPAQAIYGVLPYEQDLTGLGVISGTVASNYARNQLNEFAIPEWGSRVSVDGMTLRTLAGNPAHVGDVEAGQSVRMFGLPSVFGGARNVGSSDVVLGEVARSTDQPGVITIAPRRVAVRNVADLAKAAVEARNANADRKYKAA